MINPFVFDTNCLISVHLPRNSTSRMAYDLAFKKELLVRSSETFLELANTSIKSKFLSLAVSAKANCIITGDNDLQDLKTYRVIPIISASDFIN